MKKALLIARILLGALFVFASVMYFLNLAPQPELTGDMATFMTGLAVSKYIFPLAKLTELLCGIAFITGFFVPLAAIVILPISVNIFFIHLIFEPQEIAIALFVILANASIIYENWDQYKHLFCKKK